MMPPEGSWDRWKLEQWFREWTGGCSQHGAVGRLNKASSEQQFSRCAHGWSSFWNHWALYLGLVRVHHWENPLSWPIAQGPKGRRDRPPGYASGWSILSITRKTPAWVMYFLCNHNYLHWLFINDKQVKPDLLQQEAGYVSSLLCRMRFSQERTRRLELVMCREEGSMGMGIHLGYGFL